MPKKMHIAHFSNTYYPVTSGVVRSVSTFRESLTELGHNVFVFSQQSDSSYEDREPFVFRYAAMDLPLLPDFPVTIPISTFVDKVMPILKLDVIHSHHPFLLGQSAARKAEELNLPLVFTFHTRYQEYSHYVSVNQELVKKAISGWLGDYMKNCHHIVVPSQGIKDMLEDTYDIRSQVTVVPTGIDLKPYQNADGQALRQQQGWGDDMVLISAGRMAKEKNWKTLLEAAQRVMKKQDNVRLVLLGDGDEREALQAYSQELGISDRVQFTGNVPFEEIPGYLKASDLFCFASVTETQGLVTMEAMAAGLPVVAVNATGTRDVVDDGQDGLLTDNDSEALAAAIERVLVNKALRQSLSAAAPEKAKTFDTLEQAKRMLRVYERAIEDKIADRRIPIAEEMTGFSLLDEEKWYNFLGLG